MNPANRYNSARTTQSRRLFRLTCTIILTLFALAILSPRISFAAAPQFEQVGNPRIFPQAPGVHETVFRDSRGSSAFDHIGLHRYVLDSTGSARSSIVMLYLPGTNMNGEVANDDPRYSLMLYLARHGVDFWALDYRTHFIPPQTPIDQLSELKGWTNELFEADIDAAARFVIAKTGRPRIFIAGFSRGVSFAYAYAARDPAHVQGLVLFDGIAMNNNHKGAPAGDVYATDVAGKHLTWDKRQALLKMVIENPGQAAPIPQFKTAGDNLAHVIYSSAAFGGKGGLANPYGGFTNLQVIARVLLGFDRYWPAIQDYGDAGNIPVNTGAIAKIPILAFSSTNMSPDWPQRVSDSATATGSKDVTVTPLKGWGHLDVICGTHADADVFAPTLAWLRRHQTAETDGRSARDASIAAAGPGPAPTPQKESR
jgi:dienelactone hydrolase